MAEDLDLKANYSNKAELYSDLLPQIRSLISSEDDLIANLANIAAILKTSCNFLWVGFYHVKDEQLVLGPFQGPMACTRIQFGKGVCGTAWQKNETMVVDNVDEFPGHITCSTASKSEIVVPIRKNKEVFLVLDVDSDELADFDVEDKNFLEGLTSIIEEKYS